MEKNTMVCLLASMALIGNSGAADMPEWKYYSETEVIAQSWETTQSVFADFTYLLGKVKESGVFDENSLRVRLAIGLAGECEGLALPCRLQKEKDYDPKKNAVGELIFIVPAEQQPAAAKKKIRIYFDVIKAGPKPKMEYGRLIGEPNLAPNPGFEKDDNNDGIPDNTPYFDLTRSNGLDMAVFHSGKRSVKLCGADKYTSCGGVCITGITETQGLRVQGNKAYIFGFWSKAENCSGGYYSYPSFDAIITSSVYWYDSQRKHIDPYFGVANISGAPPVSWDWQFKRNVLTAPAGVFTAKFGVSFPCRQGTAWIDDPLITPVVPVELTKCSKNE